MIIYFNGRFLTQSVTGVQRYAIEIVKTLDEMLEENKYLKGYDIIVLVPRNVKQQIHFKNIQFKQIGRLRGHFWEQFDLPLYTKKGMLINLCNTAPVMKKNQILTIHDMSVFACPDAFSVAFRIWYKILFRFLSKRLDKIITVSRFSKNELHRFCNISLSKIHDIHLGIDHILKIKGNEEILNVYRLKKKNFILAVSSLNPNKNFKSIMYAAKVNSDIQYIIAGSLNPDVFNSAELFFPENVLYIGYVTDQELVGLYKNAGCFIYPSLYEGFGFPPLEAMACGCPVLVSNAASLPEICGEAAIYCDPLDARDIAEKSRRLIYDKELQRSCTEKGLRWSRQYSWNRTVRQFVQVIET